MGYFKEYKMRIFIIVVSMIDDKWCICYVSKGERDLCSYVKLLLLYLLFI